MPEISASVGSRGRNRLEDVKVVQRLLNKWQRDIRLARPLVVDGLPGRNTVLAIVEFQSRVVGMMEPDGRVDPGGMTLRNLNARAPRLRMLADQGPGYYTYGLDRKRFGTWATLNSVRRVARSVLALGLEIGIGNVSLEGGGRMPPHLSHQRGVDVDFRPLRTDTRRLPVRIGQPEYSRTDTRKLVRVLRQDDNVDLILFNDNAISGVTFWTGHDNHLHVRYKS